MKRLIKHRLLPLALTAACLPVVHASEISGTLYYTTYMGGQNVWDITYSYNDVNHSFSLGSPNNIATTHGADGIIFAPNGNLLIGGQSSGNVYEVTTGGTLVNTQNTGTDSYHLTLDPSGNKVYTSTFGGPLNTVSLPIGTGSTTLPITGGDAGLTQIAFGDKGTVFYVNGLPNGQGNLGTINLTTGVTNQMYSAVVPAHGLIYDPYTDLITMFGDGQVGTMNATDGTNLKTSGNIDNCTNFDQGAVDGKGHALVAGCNGSGITLIDYSLSKDITNPDFTATLFASFNIDDVAPLVGAGSNPNPTVPEPDSLALAGLGLLGLAAARRRIKTA